MPAVLLPQLVDLALGSPEVGAVNFNVLHTLLHAMISKLGLDDTKAELSEYDRDFLSTVTKPSQPSAQNRAPEAVSEKDESTTKSVEPKSGVGGVVGAVIPQNVSVYHHLEGKVADLEKSLASLNSLPTTHEFLIEVKGDAPSTKSTVNNMWQLMQVKRRVQANEDGIEKFSIMMDEVLSKMNHLSAENEALRKSFEGFANLDFEGLLKRLAELEKISEALQKTLTNDLKNMMNRFELLPSSEEFLHFVRWGDLEDALKGIRTELEKLVNAEPVQPIVMTTSVQTEKSPTPPRPASASVSLPESRPGSARSLGPSSEVLDILETLGSVSTQYIKLEKRVTKLEEDMENKMDKGVLDNLGFTDDLFRELSKMIEDFKDLQKEIAKLKEKPGVDPKLMDKLQKEIQENQDAIDRLHKRTDSEAKNKSIKELFDICDRLEKRKADKEYVAREVDVKADKNQLESKVNHHVFENTTADINKAIKNIFDQLENNSGEWEKMLAQLMNDLEGKLDRTELNSLKEWLEQKLKALSKKIKDGNLQYSEDDAAGLRKQLLQHYHCLSCDKPMEITPTGIQSAGHINTGMPPSRSPRPYTTYELDQIRQHAKSFGSPEQMDFYTTSRQCGGQHTTTLPHQRFSRFTSTVSSLFKEEEPQEIFPPHKEEVDVKGADGQIYRGRVNRLEAKMPGRMAYICTNQNNSENSKSGRPMSARVQVASPTPPRHPGSRSARPASARKQKTCELPSAQSPSADTMTDQDIVMIEQAAREIIELSPDVTPVHGE